MWAAQHYKCSKSQEHSLPQEDLEPWDMVLELHLEPRSEDRKKTVVNIAGDGCFRMNMNEIATAARKIIQFTEPNSRNFRTRKRAKDTGS